MNFLRRARDKSRGAAGTDGKGEHHGHETRVRHRKKRLEARPSWRLEKGNPLQIAKAVDGAGKPTSTAKPAPSGGQTAAAGAGAPPSPVPGGAGGAGGKPLVSKHLAAVAASSRPVAHSWTRGAGNPLLHAVPADDEKLDAVLSGRGTHGESDASEMRDVTQWRTAVDGRTGEVYYYNIRTKQETTDLAKIPVWDRAKDAASGDDYYFNTRTGEVTWERPDGYISPAEKAVEDERKLPEGDPGAIQEW